MCGIAGIIATDSLQADDLARSIRMRDTLTHRGPDGAGLWHDERAALAHRRLSIVDLAGGHQPLSNEDGTVWITFNGEIYNHTELRRELETSGHHYRTRSDTETIVHAYEQWGEGCVHRLRGMFAFAIWDAPKRRLLLVRDRLGVKPVYWARRGGRFLFASEIKALLASDLVDAQPNIDRLPEVLSTRTVAGADTLYRGIQKLEPGHLLVLEGRELRVRQYWDVPIAAGRMGVHRSATRDAVVREFSARLEESIRLRLMSDVPLGMFLSGGLDSSAVAALMARQLTRPLQTFSVAFEEKAFSELAYSRQVADAIGAERHEVVIGAHDFFGALPKLLWHEDEPVAHSSSVPLYFVSALAGRHVKVVLTGEGSDELLAGYGRYPRTAWNWRLGTVYERVLPLPARRGVARLVAGLPGRAGRYLQRSFLSVRRSPEWMVFDNFASIRLADQRHLLETSAAELEPGAVYGRSRTYFDRVNGDSTLLDRLLYTDIKTYLVELLMKQDQMSMAASIESRVPFLDHKLVEFAARLPDEWKLSGWTTKRVLREAMRRVLPESVLNRPKMGFPVPFGAWTRGPWNSVVKEVLLDRRCRERGILNAAAVEQLLADHAAGRTDGTDRIWSLLNLELWYRTFIDGSGIQTLPAPRPVRRHAAGRLRRPRVDAVPTHSQVA
jgi:asparagine synthase (glutamine-hydrolysing)